MTEVLTGGVIEAATQDNISVFQSVKGGLKAGQAEFIQNSKEAFYMMSNPSTPHTPSDGDGIINAIKNRAEIAVAFTLWDNFSLKEAFSQGGIGEAASYLGNVAVGTMSDISAAAGPVIADASNAASQVVSQYPLGVAALASLTAANALAPYLIKRHNLSSEERKPILQDVKNKCAELKEQPRKWFKTVGSVLKDKTSPLLKLSTGKTFDDYKEIFTANDKGFFDNAKDMFISFVKSGNFTFASATVAVDNNEKTDSLTINKGSFSPERAKLALAARAVPAIRPSAQKSNPSVQNHNHNISAIKALKTIGRNK